MSAQNISYTAIVSCVAFLTSISLNAYLIDVARTSTESDRQIALGLSAMMLFMNIIGFIVSALMAVGVVSQHSKIPNGIVIGLMILNTSFVAALANRGNTTTNESGFNRAVEGITIVQFIPLVLSIILFRGQYCSMVQIAPHNE